jgi:S-DNA-T family DNA segregation ATPase FtsK/SpoIIIE
MQKRRKNTTRNYSKEASSLIIIGLGIILLLALISYDRTDNPDLEIKNNTIQINNWLGPLGAAIADPLLNYTLGYPVIVIPVLLIFIGLQIYRERSFEESLRPAILMIIWAVLLSVILALPEAFENWGNMKEYFPSGMIGGEIASYSVMYLSKFGTILIVTIMSAALLLVTMRLDIQQFLDLLLGFVRQVTADVKNQWQVFQDRRVKARKARLQQLMRKKAEEERARMEIRTTMEPPSKPEIPPSVPERKAAPQADPERVIAAEQEKTEAPDTEPQVSVRPQPEESEKQADEEDMDFEVREEAKIEEVDYDQLVQRSLAQYEYPSIDLLESPPPEDSTVTREELRANAAMLEAKLLDFGVQAKVIRVTAGPVITLYELQPAPGVKVSQIVSLTNDLALAMEAKGIRMVAPIPGKAAIGIEIPNRNPQTVFLKPLLRSERFVQANYRLPLALGRMINGEVYCADLTKMPHLLMAGSTGSGKSVGINTIIASILYRIDPSKVKFVMIDPKKIELSIYRPLTEHYLLWRPDLDEEVITKPSNAVSILNTMVLEMENRYDKLAHLGVRSIDDYNDRVRTGGPRIKEEKLQILPYIVVVIDELADLMMVAAKEVENPISRLTQMARAVGIHLILATQRPSVDVITGVIKANFPARIAYMVTSRPDSKTILDQNGAEQLLGNGDMLYQPPGEPRPVRLQNPLITTNEVDRLISHIRKQPKFPHYSLPQPADSKNAALNGFDSGGTDELYEEAKRIVVQHQQGSISLLQRRLKIGYSRAARLIDEMEEEGVVGPPDGSKPRQVYYLPEDL